MIGRAGNTPHGAAWLFVAQTLGLPAAGLAVPSLDFDEYGGVEAFGFLHAAVEESVQIPQVVRLVLDIFDPRQIQFLDGEAAPDEKY